LLDVHPHDLFDVVRAERPAATCGLGTLMIGAERALVRTAAAGVEAGSPPPAVRAHTLRAATAGIGRAFDARQDRS